MKATKKDVYYKGGEHNCTSLDLVEKLICDLKLSDVHVVKGIFPDDVKEKFENKKTGLSI